MIPLRQKDIMAKAAVENAIELNAVTANNSRRP